MSPHAVAFMWMGRPVSVGRMMELLEQEDPIALAFVEDVIAAATRMICVQSKVQSDMRRTTIHMPSVVDPSKR